MNVTIGIAVLSVMITVIAFFVGFMWVSVGHLVGEVSGTIGFLKGTADRIRRERIGRKKGEKPKLEVVLRKKAELAEDEKTKLEKKIRCVFVVCVLGVCVLVLLLTLIGDYQVEWVVGGGWVIFGSAVGVLSYGTIVSMRMWSDYAELSRLRESSLRDSSLR